jgi:hypothetical protein
MLLLLQPIHGVKQITDAAAVVAFAARPPGAGEAAKVTNMLLPASVQGLPVRPDLDISCQPDGQHVALSGAG